MAKTHIRIGSPSSPQPAKRRFNPQSLHCDFERGNRSARARVCAPFEQGAPERGSGCWGGGGECSLSSPGGQGKRGHWSFAVYKGPGRGTVYEVTTWAHLPPGGGSCFHFFLPQTLKDSHCPLPILNSCHTYLIGSTKVVPHSPVSLHHMPL